MRKREKERENYLDLYIIVNVLLSFFFKEHTMSKDYISYREHSLAQKQCTAYNKPRSSIRAEAEERKLDKALRQQKRKKGSRILIYKGKAKDAQH